MMNSNLTIFLKPSVWLRLERFVSQEMFYVHSKNSKTGNRTSVRDSDVTQNLRREQRHSYKEIEVGMQANSLKFQKHAPIQTRET